MGRWGAQRCGGILILGTQINVGPVVAIHIIRLCDV